MNIVKINACKIAKTMFADILHRNHSVAGILAEWIDESFTSLKVMWSDMSVQGALTTYKVTYEPVGNTAEIMNASSSRELTTTAMNSRIVLTGLNPSELYFLHVEVVVFPVTINSDQVAIGKCMHVCILAHVVHIQVHLLAAIPVNHSISVLYKIKVLVLSFTYVGASIGVVLAIASIAVLALLCFLFLW